MEQTTIEIGLYIAGLVMGGAMGFTICWALMSADQLEKEDKKGENNEYNTRICPGLDHWWAGDVLL